MTSGERFGRSTLAGLVRHVVLRERGGGHGVEGEQGGEEEGEDESRGASHQSFTSLPRAARFMPFGASVTTVRLSSRKYFLAASRMSPGVTPV